MGSQQSAQHMNIGLCIKERGGEEEEEFYVDQSAYLITYIKTTVPTTNEKQSRPLNKILRLL